MRDYLAIASLAGGIGSCFSVLIILAGGALSGMQRRSNSARHLTLFVITAVAVAGVGAQVWRPADATADTPTIAAPLRIQRASSSLERSQGEQNVAALIAAMSLMFGVLATPWALRRFGIA